jgi:hypothetical protein
MGQEFGQAKFCIQYKLGYLDGIVTGMYISRRFNGQFTTYLGVCHQR